MGYDIFHSYGFDRSRKLNESASLSSYVHVIRKDIDYAKKVFEADPSVPFAEILAKRGYNQPDYFSNVFYKDGDTLTFVIDLDQGIDHIVYYAQFDNGSIVDGAYYDYNWHPDDVELVLEGDIVECTATRKNLDEAYNNLPSWFTTFLDKHPDVKKALSQRGIDLANATYIKSDMPRSNRDPVLRDNSRLAIFRLNNGRGEIVYIKGVNNPYLHTNGWEYKYADELPMKTILEMTTEYGYIDTNDERNSNKSIRRDRANLRYKYPPRGKGQYPVERTIYATDENGKKDYSNPVGTEIEWVMTKGQDKSGYPIDPDKYTKMLDNVGLADHSARLDSYYKQIEDLRQQLIVLMQENTTVSAVKKVNTKVYSRNTYEKISEATRELSNCIEYYRRICERCKEIVESDISDEEKDERINQTFRWDARYFRDSVKDCKKAISEAKEFVEPDVEDTVEESVDPENVKVLKNTASEILNNVDETNSGKYISTIRSILNAVPDEAVDEVVGVINTKFGDVELPESTVNQLKETVPEVEGNKVKDFLNSGVLAKAIHLGFSAIKWVGVIILGVIAVVEPTPLGEALTALLMTLPADRLADLTVGLIRDLA